MESEAFSFADLPNDVFGKIIQTRIGEDEFHFVRCHLSVGHSATTLQAYVRITIYLEQLCAVSAVEMEARSAKAGRIVDVFKLLASFTAEAENLFVKTMTLAGYEPCNRKLGQTEEALWRRWRGGGLGTLRNGNWVATNCFYSDAEFSCSIAPDPLETQREKESKIMTRMTKALEELGNDDNNGGKFKRHELRVKREVVHLAAVGGHAWLKVLLPCVALQRMAVTCRFFRDVVENERKSGRLAQAPSPLVSAPVSLLADDRVKSLADVVDCQTEERD